MRKYLTKDKRKKMFESIDKIPDERERNQMYTLIKKQLEERPNCKLIRGLIFTSPKELRLIANQMADLNKKNKLPADNEGMIPINNHSGQPDDWVFEKEENKMMDEILSVLSKYTKEEISVFDINLNYDLNYD